MRVDIQDKKHINFESVGVGSCAIWDSQNIAFIKIEAVIERGISYNAVNLFNGEPIHLEAKTQCTNAVSKVVIEK